MAVIQDIALRYDARIGRCDIAVEGRDLAVDRTPVSRMLLRLGCDARARADDRLPEEPEAAPPSVVVLNPRRGWAGDALSLAGRRLGSRLWLLARAKQTEETRLSAIRYAEEALARLGNDLGLAIRVTASWPRRGLLQLVVRAGRTEIRVTQQVGA
ncbi:phage GP46 family protein [Plastoroseomonas hellenica]|uniref:phage GP46 family protein n=1 Tax=Plastoroseomonas hellenica TaxID=2687306 RepID=UPI001BA92A67|nr:phage GP46 family protein [Plastoroseomonas hellenica]MBR0643980.1 hypothetical protein [Plastoroseomonas hellenica]